MIISDNYFLKTYYANIIKNDANHNHYKAVNHSDFNTIKVQASDAESNNNLEVEKAQAPILDSLKDLDFLPNDQLSNDTRSTFKYILDNLNCLFLVNLIFKQSLMYPFKTRLYLTYVSIIIMSIINLGLYNNYYIEHKFNSSGDEVSILLLF